MAWANQRRILFLLTLSGCAYVTQGDYLDKVNSLDQDDDGVPDGEDCAPSDPARFPGNLEIPYDGIDQDCDNDRVDAVDLDCDGFAGVDYESYVAEYGEDAWPDGLEASIDCLDGETLCRCTSNGPVDCTTLEGDPAELPVEAAQTYPSAVDAWYDGMDQDCAIDNDFDRDGDGYIPDPYQSTYEDYRDELGATDEQLGFLGIGDCNDEQAKIFPGASGEIQYDGIDTNCDASNDFDADGDGYILDSWANEFFDYLDEYGLSEDDVGFLGDGDCDDTDVDRFPGAAETWYDGLDANCDGANDFDQDGDGYVPDEYIGQVTIPGGDCADLVASQHPGVGEILGDEIDQDCDGDLNWGEVLDDQTTWRGIGRLVADHNEQHFLIATSATRSNFNSSPPFAAILAFDLTNEYPAEVSKGTWLKTPGGTTSHVIDLVPDGDAVIGSGVYYGPPTMLGSYYLEWSGNAYAHTTVGRTTGTTSDNVEIPNDVHGTLDGDVSWAVACTNDSFNFLAGTYADGEWESSNGAIAVGGTTCWVEPPGDQGPVALGTACLAGSCVSYDLDREIGAVSVSLDQPYFGQDIEWHDEQDGWTLRIISGELVISDDGTSFDPVPSLAGLSILDASIAGSSELVYIALVVDDGAGGELRFFWGDPAGTLEEANVVLPWDDANVSTAALSATDERLVLAVGASLCTIDNAPTDECERIGWLTFGI